MATNSKQNNSNKHYTSFFSVLIASLAICSFLFYPRIASIVFPFKRESSAAAFKKKIIVQKKVDPQEFWKFREFYDLGAFDFKKEGFNTMIISKKIEAMRIDIDPSAIGKPFLLYSSPHISSIDSLISSPIIDNIINPEDVALVTISKGDNYILFNKNNNDYLLFILPISEMKKANGYFDYREPSVMKELQGKYWLDISVIK